MPKDQVNRKVEKEIKKLCHSNIKLHLILSVFMIIISFAMFFYLKNNIFSLPITQKQEVVMLMDKHNDYLLSLETNSELEKYLVKRCVGTTDRLIESTHLIYFLFLILPVLMIWILGWYILGGTLLKRKCKKMINFLDKDGIYKT